MSAETPILNEVQIEKWVYGGDGLARIPAAPARESATDSAAPVSGKAPGSRVVLTPFVLPGERVRVRLSDKLHAELQEVIEPSPDRVDPACPLFTTCGGCHYQHASDEYQLARKVEILREQLERVGKIQYQGDIATVSGPPLGYRNRAQFHVAENARGERRIGYLAPRSHELVPIEGECPTVSPRLNQVLALMRERLHDPQWPRFVQGVEVFTNEQEIQVNVIASDKPVARRFYDWFESAVAIDYPTGVGTFRVSPKSFFQVNRFLIDQLVATVLGDHTGDSALELYAGAGLFALPLAQRFARVTAVEGISAAAHDLSFNAERAENGDRITAEYARVEEYLESLDPSLGASNDPAPDLIVADPPRVGLGKSVVRHLNRIAAPRLTIVSCDPATLARDLAGLSGYRIESLTLVDLFPQTFHMETVTHLTRS